MIRANVVLHCHACREPAGYRLHDLNFCAAHYIEALEHCGHIVTPSFAEKADGMASERVAAGNADRWRVENLIDRITERAVERKKREELRGRPEGNLPFDSI
jgi:hypothetical protein